VTRPSIQHSSGRALARPDSFFESPGSSERADSTLRAARRKATRAAIRSSHCCPACRARPTRTRSPNSDAERPPASHATALRASPRRLVGAHVRRRPRIDARQPFTDAWEATSDAPPAQASPRRNEPLPATYTARDMLGAPSSGAHPARARSARGAGRERDVFRSTSCMIAVSWLRSATSRFSVGFSS